MSFATAAQRRNCISGSKRKSAVKLDDSPSQLRRFRHAATHLLEKAVRSEYTERDLYRPERCRGKPRADSPDRRSIACYFPQANGARLLLPDKEMAMAHQQFAECIKACYDCADACDHCAVACLAEDDPKMMARCIELDMDCAQVCRLAAAYMARNSDFVSAICSVCADVCEACGKECAQHDMQHCQECADACRRCAELCRQMATGQPSTVKAGRGAAITA